MSVRTAVVTRASAFAGLTALVSTRIWPDTVPVTCTSPTPTPYVLFEKVSTKFHLAMGVIVRRTYRIRFNSWALTSLAADALNEQIIAAFAFYTGGEIVGSIPDNNDDEKLQWDTAAQLWRSSTDFFITI